MVFWLLLVVLKVHVLTLDAVLYMSPEHAWNID